MIKVVPDSSILIDHLRNGHAWRNFLADNKKNVEFYLPTIVIFELYSGKSTQNAFVIEKLTNLLKPFKRIELTEVISQRAGILYRDLKKDIQIADYIIAASALEVDGTVLTLNKKHFEQIPGVRIYLL